MSLLQRALSSRGNAPAVDDLPAPDAAAADAPAPAAADAALVDEARELLDAALKSPAGAAQARALSEAVRAQRFPAWELVHAGAPKALATLVGGQGSSPEMRNASLLMLMHMTSFKSGPHVARALFDATGLVQACTAAARGEGGVSDSGRAEAFRVLGFIAWNSSTTEPVMKAPGLLDAALEAYLRKPKTAHKVRSQALGLLSNLCQSQNNAVVLARVPGFLDSLVQLVARKNAPGDMKRRAVATLYHFACAPELESMLLARNDMVSALLPIAHGKTGDAPRATMTLAVVVGRDEERSSMLRSNERSLLEIVALLKRVVDKVNANDWPLEKLLLPIRYLSVVKFNRAMLSRSLMPDLLTRALAMAVENGDQASTALAVEALSQFAFEDFHLQEIKNPKFGVEDILKKALSWGPCKASAAASGLLWTMRGGDVPSGGGGAAPATGGLLVSEKVEDEEEEDEEEERCRRGASRQSRRSPAAHGIVQLGLANVGAQGHGSAARKWIRCLDRRGPHECGHYDGHGRRRGQLGRGHCDCVPQV